jgi:hypothetical protein
MIDTSASAVQLDHNSRVFDQVVGCLESPSPCQPIQCSNLALTATKPSAQHPTVLLKQAGSSTNTSPDSLSYQVKLIDRNPSYNKKDESTFFGSIFVHETVLESSLPLDPLFPGNVGVAAANGGGNDVLSHDRGEKVVESQDYNGSKESSSPIFPRIHSTENSKFAFSDSSSTDGQSYPNYQPCASPAEPLQQMANYLSPEFSILSSGLINPILDLSDEVRNLLVSEIIMLVTLPYLLF